MIEFLSAVLCTMVNTIGVGFVTWISIDIGILLVSKFIKPRSLSEKEISLLIDISYPALIRVFDLFF